MTALLSHRRAVPAAIGLATVLALGLSACTSSGNNGGGGGSPTHGASTPAGTSTSAGTTSSGSSGIAQAKALADKYGQAPTSIGITQPVGKPIPTGKLIVDIGAGPGGEGTIVAEGAMNQAVKILGWQLKFIQPQAPTPQLLQQALNQAIQLHPDGVIINAIESAPVASQLKTLQDMHVPVILVNGPEPTGGLLTLSISGIDQLGPLAAAVADKALADMGAPGTIGIVDLQGYTIVGDWIKVFKQEISKYCPTCTIKNSSITPTSLATGGGADIVNFVRANPGMKALFVGYDGMAGGLFTAAKAAGVTLPKTYSVATAPTSIQYLASGQLSASAPLDQGEMGWRTLDAFARIFTGQTASAQKVDVEYSRPMIWSQSYNNVPAAPQGDTFPDLVQGYPDQYKKLWGK